MQVIDAAMSRSRTVVLGDFNQHIPRKYAPKRVYEELLRVFEPFEIATAGELSGAPGLSIDHIAHSADLSRESVGIWQRRTVDDESLADHFGVWCEFRRVAG